MYKHSTVKIFLPRDKTNLSKILWVNFFLGLFHSRLHFIFLPSAVRRGLALSFDPHSREKLGKGGGLPSWGVVSFFSALTSPSIFPASSRAGGEAKISPTMALFIKAHLVFLRSSVSPLNSFSFFFFFWIVKSVRCFRRVHCFIVRLHLNLFFIHVQITFLNSKFDQ